LQGFVSHFISSFAKTVHLHLCSACLCKKAPPMRPL
jgi:hypothetical protein